MGARAATGGRPYDPQDFGGMPADLDGINPNAPGSPFTARTFQLRAADDTLTPGPNPTLPVLAAQRTRWDIELLP